MAVTLGTWAIYALYLVHAVRGRLARPPRRVPRARRVRARDRRPPRTPGDPLLMNLTLVGLSHQSTPIAVRERAFVPLPEAGGARARARGRGRGRLPVDLQPHRALPRRRRRRVSRASPRSVSVSGLSEDELRAVVYRLHDEAAALHLFRVAAGLDSMVPGEGEILGQVREAFEAGAPGPILDRLFREALHAGKKVRAETAIGESPASVSSAAAALAQQVFGDLGRLPRPARRRRARRRAGRAEPRRARCVDRVRRQPLRGPRARARGSLRRRGDSARRRRRPAGRGRRPA